MALGVSGLLRLFHSLLYSGRHLPACAVLLVLNVPLNTLLKRGFLGHWVLVVPGFVHTPFRTLGKMCQLLWLVAVAASVPLPSGIGPATHSIDESRLREGSGRLRLNADECFQPPSSGFVPNRLRKASD